MIESKPYKLVNYIQNYEWGTKGKNAFLPKLMGFEGEERPYAELWIGSHPKLSSDILIESESYKLKEIIEKYPNEILGKSVAEKFGNKLPFLLKILSANQALSIQTHPNKLQAAELHKNDPQNYPDDNHKPEIAITLDSLSALVGFRPLNEIEKILDEISELSSFIGSETVNKFHENKSKSGLKELFSMLMNNSTDSEKLKKTIETLKNNFELKKILIEDEKLFITLYYQYGIDIGLLVLFFLNVVKLEPGDAIYTPAGIPHAYLEGNIVECMANSDNVVRAGLTPKFKDIDQLTNILTYQYGAPEIIGKQLNNNVKQFSVSAEEFRVEKIFLNKESIEFKTDNRVEIILLIEGKISCDNLSLLPGETILIPALLNSYSINSRTNAAFFRVVVPN
jgi:mannose-6-phosphate isomerase